MNTKFIYFLIALAPYLVGAQSKSLQKKQVKAERLRAQKSLLFSENENPNTLNYDLRYIRMELDLDPAKQLVKGSVTSHFKMLTPSSCIYFDLANRLTVSEVRYRNQAIPFQQLPSKELKINFPTEIPAMAMDSLSIYYSGVPDDSEEAFTTKLQGGTPVLATLSEPFGAKEWWPTKQSLNDKIEKLDIKITTPPQYSVGANGKLISERILDSGKKMTFWQSHYATPAYLIALGITNYVKRIDQFGTGERAFPFVNYLYPSTANNSEQMAAVEWTKSCMALFEQYFGDYPFREEKYGHMQFNANGGMEHTTMSSMGFFDTGLIAHELAHQWFGDKVTCGTWNDIWLNEGFARFAEYFVNEKLLLSPNSFRSYLNNQISSITASSSGSIYIPEEQPSINRIFSARLSYDKAAFVLRMLRWEMGEDTFFSMLKAYHDAPQFAHSYVKTDSFLNFLNAFTQQDYSEFFRDWVYGEGYPTYNIRWKPSSNNGLTLRVSQTQSHSSVNFFEMTLPVTVTGAGGQKKELLLKHSSNGQYFTENIGFAVTAVSFNQDLQILTKNASVQRDNTLEVLPTEKVQVGIYPNPASHQLYTKGIESDAGYQILTLDGRVVSTGVLKSNQVISISNLEKGMYILNINNSHFKFIKQ